MVRRRSRRVGVGTFVYRWIAVLILVLLTYNPLGWSYSHWVYPFINDDLPFKVLAGIVLIIGYLICIRATWRSIGPVGVGLVIALLGAVFWVFVSLEWIEWRDPGVLTWFGLVALSTILAVGLSWSIIRRWLTGQMDVDDADTHSI